MKGQRCEQDCDSEQAQHGHSRHLHGARHMLVQYGGRWKPRLDPDHRALMAAIRARDVKAALATAERHLGRAV